MNLITEKNYKTNDFSISNGDYLLDISVCHSWCREGNRPKRRKPADYQTRKGAPIDQLKLEDLIRENTAFKR